MHKHFMNFIKWFAEFRSKQFGKVGKIFLKLGITANIMTTFALILGVISIYFLFIDFWLFFLFGALHLLADGLDGIIARASQPTEFGRYYDLATDRTITLLVLIKTGWFLNDYFAYIAVGLFIIAQFIYFTSKLKAPILFTRSLILGANAVKLPVLGYLITGIASVYGLALQLQWFIKKKS